MQIREIIKAFLINSEYYVLKGVILIIQHLPFPLMVAFFRTIGWVISFFLPQEKKISLVQLMFVARQLSKRDGPDPTRNSKRKFKLNPNLTLKGASRIFHASIVHSAQLVYEAMIIPWLLKKTTQSSNGSVTAHYPHIIYTQTDFLEDLRNPDKPMMSLASHIGCFELLAAYSISSANKPVSIIGRAPDNAVFARVIRDTREGYGGEIIFRDDPKSAAKLIRAVQNKGLIGVLIDQDVALKHEFSPFFDLDAAYPEAPIRLAIRFELAIYSTFIVREDVSRHKIFTDKIDYDKNDPRAIQKILARYNRNLEEVICNYPEQWFWWHRRWRRRPGIPYDQKTVWPPQTKEYLEWLDGL